MAPVDTNALPDKCNRCALRGAALCRAVKDANLPGTRLPDLRQFDRNAVIFDPDTTPGFIGVVRRGLLRRERVDRNGRRTLLNLAFPGDVVGEMFGQWLPSSLVAAIEAEVCIFDPDTTQRMMEGDARFRLQLMHETTRQHEEQLRMIWQRGALTSRERIVAFLAYSVDVMPTEPQPDGSVIVTIGLSRRDWADLSNTSVETISRTIGQLTEKGLIETVTPGRYRIHNLARLSRMAGLDPELDQSCNRAPGHPRHPKRVEDRQCARARMG